MKYMILILSAALVFSTSTYAQDNAKGAKMQFESEEVDYGDIQQDSEPLRVFSFKNTGTEPLVITSAKGSCGCTVPNYPKEPIMPGATSEIEVRYDTHRIGSFTKTITLTTNAVNSTTDKPAGTFVLRIKGKVDMPADNTTPAGGTIIPN